MRDSAVCDARTRPSVASKKGLLLLGDIDSEDTFVAAHGTEDLSLFSREVRPTREALCCSIETYLYLFTIYF